MSDAPKPVASTENLQSALRAERAKTKSLRELLGVKTLGEAVLKVGQLQEQLQGLPALRQELDGLKAQAASPDDKDAKIADLTGQLAARDHRDAFRAAAAKNGVHPDRVDDLYSVSGLKPGDAPAKPEDFADFLSAAKTARGWAFGEGTATPGATTGDTTTTPAPQGGAATTTPPAQQPAPVGGRGGGDTSAARVQYALADVRVPGWQQKNPALVKALQDGTAICVG